MKEREADEAKKRAEEIKAETGKADDAAAKVAEAMAAEMIKLRDQMAALAAANEKAQCVPLQLSKCAEINLNCMAQAQCGL